MKINGDIENMKDGTIYITEIYPVFNQGVDSAEVIKGKFSFEIPHKSYPESPVVKLHHIDKSGMKTMITLLSPKKTKGKAFYVESFMLEDGVLINGKLIDIDLGNNFKLPEKTKLANIDTPVKGGIQNEAFNGDTLSFSRVRKVETLVNLVKQNSGSYHYLYELMKRFPQLSESHFNSIFEEFDEEIKESKTGKELKNHVQNRMQRRLNFETTMIDPGGKTKLVLDTEAELNMVVLWASWCGPCRKEIPLLKELHHKLKSGPRVNLVSVSLDKDPRMWQKALQQENMSWQQFIIPPGLEKYQRDLFQFDGHIPTTLFLDKSGKIVHKITGYDEKAGLPELEKVIQYTLNRSPM